MPKSESVEVKGVNVSFNPEPMSDSVEGKDVKVIFNNPNDFQADTSSKMEIEAPSIGNSDLYPVREENVNSGAKLPTRHRRRSGVTKVQMEKPNKVDLTVVDVE